MTSWRYCSLTANVDLSLYTELSDAEIEELFEDALLSMCDCEDHFDVDENPDRWTKSRYFPTCRLQVGGWTINVSSGLESELS